MVGLISSAAVEQNSGIQSVSQAMTELNKSASESNGMAQSISELSGSLKAESDALSETVQNLNSLVMGRRQAGRFVVPEFMENFDPDNTGDSDSEAA